MFHKMHLKYIKNKYLYYKNTSIIHYKFLFLIEKRELCIHEWQNIINNLYLHREIRAINPWFHTRYVY